MNGRNAKLTIMAGAHQGMEVPLVQEAFLLGRGTDCDLPLFDNYASRHHCWIEHRGDEWWIRDLGSKNGTLVNDQRVDREQRLADGDVICIGATQVRFANPSETITYEALPAQSSTRLRVDAPARMVYVDGQPIEPPLSPKQWALLHLLWEHRSEALSKDEIAAAVWPEADGAIYDYQIDKLVSRLRARMGEPGEDLIETIWGFGYKLR
jgi:predicted component of type VI protein secretion system